MYIIPNSQQYIESKAIVVAKLAKRLIPIPAISKFYINIYSLLTLEKIQKLGKRGTEWPIYEYIESTTWYGRHGFKFSIWCRFSMFTDTTSRMLSHYRMHPLSIWLNLIPRLHMAGADNIFPQHNAFIGHDDPNLFTGVVRPASFAHGYQVSRLHSPRVLPIYWYLYSMTWWSVYLYNIWQFTAMKFAQYHQHFTKVG